MDKNTTTSLKIILLFMMMMTMMTQKHQMERKDFTKTCSPTTTKKYDLFMTRQLR